MPRHNRRSDGAYSQFAFDLTHMIETKAFKSKPFPGVYLVFSVVGDSIIATSDFSFHERKTEKAKRIDQFVVGFLSLQPKRDIGDNEIRDE